MSEGTAKRSELIADLKEQLLFLKEIGVEALNADLPERTETEEPEIPHSDFQTYVPETSELISPPSGQDSKKDREPSRAARSEALRSIRLGDRPIRNPAESPGEQKPPAAEEPQPINKKEHSETKGGQEDGTALFEDFSAGLPESGETLKDVHIDIGKDCKRCRLCEKRTQVVNSVGNPNADLMFIGEAPGADEDAQGEPFVGRAGQLLTKIIEAIDLKREDVFIGNINRCRPPDNRRPLPDEASVCKPFLLREIAIVRPKVIVVLGNTACQNLLDTKTGITRLRGKFMDYFGVRVMPTFHPAYLLRDPRKKREVWEDMKMVREELNRLSGNPDK
jgi:uracil-DNA glycosylase family 4